jgi:N-acetylmuramoyl-L-alanine amidase
MGTNFAVDIGHNVAYDHGASGYCYEDALNMMVGNRVIELLKRMGYSVTNALPVTANSLQDSLYLRCTVANRDNAGFYLSIHHNAGGGRGCEVFAVSQVGKEVGARICSNLSAIGFENRGVKDGSHLYVIRNTDMPAALVEVAFVDTKSDMDLENAVGIEAIARAIVSGLTNQAIPEQNTNVEKVVDNMSVLELQKLCNKLGCTDFEGKPLDEDGILGKRTESAKAKLKSWLQYILN